MQKKENTSTKPVKNTEEEYPTILESINEYYGTCK